MDADEREMARFFGLSFSATSGSWRRNFWRGDKKIIGCVNCWSSLYLWICYGLEWTRTVILIQAEGKGIKMEKKFPAQFRLILESIVLAEKLQTSSRNWNKKTWQLRPLTKVHSDICLIFPLILNAYNTENCLQSKRFARVQQQDKRSCVYVSLWQGGPETAVEKLLILQFHVNVVFICSGNTKDFLPDFYGLLGRKILLLAGPNKVMHQWLLSTMADVRHCYSASSPFPSTPELLIAFSKCSCLHFSQQKRAKPSVI